MGSSDLTINNNAKNKFKISNVLDKLYLILCLHLNLLTLIFSNQTFVILKLTLFEQLFYFKILLEQKQLPVSLKKKIEYILLFCYSKNIINSIYIFNNQALSNNAFQLLIIKLGNVTNIKFSTSPYTF